MNTWFPSKWFLPKFVVSQKGTYFFLLLLIPYYKRKECLKLVLILSIMFKDTVEKLCESFDIQDDDYGLHKKISK